MPCSTCVYFDRAFPENRQLGFCRGIQIEHLPGGGIGLVRRTVKWIPGDESLRLMDDFGCAFHLKKADKKSEAHPISKAMKYKSCAAWPVDCCPMIGNYSEDEHYTRAEAEGVCEILKAHGFGGDHQFFPVRVWVEEIKPQDSLLNTET